MKLSVDVGMILLFATSAGYFVKPIVDVFKKTPLPTPSWSLPFLAIGIGIVVCFLLILMTGNPITVQSISASVLAGGVAGIGAIATTELGRSADSAN